jgi:hypothetical protein
MVWGVSVTPRPRFSPGERIPSTHCTGGWVGPRACLNTEARGKILSPLPASLDRPVVQPVARHYTDWATLLSPVESSLILNNCFPCIVAPTASGLTCIDRTSQSTSALYQEVPGLNLGPETGCTDWDYLWFSSVNTGKCPRIRLLQLPYIFLPIHFSLIVLSSDVV